MLGFQLVSNALGSFAERLSRGRYFFDTFEDVISIDAKHNR